VARGRETWWEGGIAPVELDGGAGVLLSAHEVEGPRGELRARLAAAERAEEALRESEDRHRRLVEQVSDGIFLASAEGRYVDVNPAGCEMLGMTREEVLSRTFLDVLDPAEHARIPTVVAGFADGKVHRSEWRFRRKDGSVFVGELDGRRLPDGRLQGAVRDVTARKRVEEALRDSERLYRAIGESIDFGVWVCAPDGKNIYASDSFLKLVGITQQQCSDFGWGDVLHPEDAERTIAAWKACVRSGGTWDMEHRFRGVDGKWHPVLARGVPVKNEAGQVVYWAGINLDISRLKDAEESLREANRRKDEFLGMLSHELRNPLAPIRNSAWILQRVDPASEEARRALLVIDRQTEHLAHIVDDLLDVTRIARGKIELHRERVDLREIARKMTHDLSGLFEQAGVELRVRPMGDVPVAVEGDAIRLSQALGNLLHNAVKFTPAAGVVEVALAVAGGAAELRVRDTGVGMNPADVERMFEPFTQADQTLARSKGGLGLGLALVKALAELHGGRAEARSEGLGRGAEVVVRLPLAPPLADVPPARPAPEGVRRRVVIIEDNADAGQSLAEVLELDGHEVSVARDGRSGLALVRRVRPDVVLCDVGLPDVDGYEVARAIRRDEALRAVRLVALSGYAQPEDRERAKAAGFDLHLAKPPDLDQLARALAGEP
jgi:PAS domain S-box-containing protein